MSSRQSVIVILIVIGCTEAPSLKNTPSRIDTVSAVPATKATICDTTFDKAGAKVRPFKLPALRPLALGKLLETHQQWLWVNLWATWCAPCREEMALLKRWQTAMQGDGIDFALQLVSIDAPEDEAKLQSAIHQGLPSETVWLDGENAFSAIKETLGLGHDAAIPIHALVDPNGNLRCVRVGAV